MSIRVALVVPHFNHAEAFGRFLPRLLDVGLPIIVVDDASEHDQLEAVESLAAKHGMRVERHRENQGKGGAVMTGLRAAAAAGFSHALQIDADGQHDDTDIPKMLATARNRPEALVCGRPVFGEDIPAARRRGRMLTNGLVVLETWSRQVPDAMCGFRVYPLDTVVPLIDRARPGRRMDFDVEILVRASWSGLPMTFVPTRVSYPDGGVSHFDYLRDNAIMTALHARLLAGMLLRAPLLLYRRLAGARPAER